ncbi:MAG: 3-oxoacyl-ACP reductase FabG [Planctomycetota bacterium]|nr:3-oxoacyl-ACP reductase FabG [Planctomycetota bacterium]
MKRRVLITGASRGIGRAVTIELAGAGFEVVLNYKSDDAAAEAALDEIRGFDGRAELLRFDVADRGAARAALAAELEANGAFWGVVHSAGVTADAPLASMKDEQWDRVIETNLTGFFNVVQPLVMPMVRLRDGGRIVAISSAAGLLGNRGQTNYAASKAGLIGATRSLALELAKRRIAVNSVAPGYIATDMTAGLDEEVVAGLVPMKRLGRPEEVAGLVGWLFSERAEYVTGQVVSIDGGMA